MNLIQLSAELEKINLDKLYNFTNKINEIPSVTKYNASVLMRDFILAQDLSSELLSKAIVLEARAKTLVGTVEAIALLDKSEEYFKQKNQKPTQDLRAAYVDLDQDVIDAKDLFAKATALAHFLKNKIYEFKSAFEAVKHISRDYQVTPNES